MLLILAIGAVVAIYGFIQGKRESLFLGVGIFILAAALRALMPLLLDQGGGDIWLDGGLGPAGPGI